VNSYDYPCEEHRYRTKDGYVNTLHYIRATDATKERKRSVFLQHGLLGSSADFVMGAPNVSLGYMLADRGYDVWMGNARGNYYSRSAVNLTVDDVEYWEFSFDQMGKYDLPAAIEYILKRQPRDYAEKIYYVGHSMGTVMYWVAMNEHEEFMDSSVEMMVAMGPVAYVDHMISPIKYLSYIQGDVEVVFSGQSCKTSIFSVALA